MTQAQRPSPSAEGHHGEMLSHVLHPVTQTADPPFPSDPFAIMTECFAEGMDAIRDRKCDAMAPVLAEMLALCQSPIEKRMCAALLGTVGACAPGSKIEPQCQIGPYRVDFVLGIPTANGPVEAVIECDGHDFHERTKDQAKRDKGRDRYLEGLGFKVLRFTGSEIWADPMVCSQQVLIILFAERRRRAGATS